MSFSQTLIILGVVVLIVISGVGFMMTRPSTLPPPVAGNGTSTVPVPTSTLAIQTFSTSYLTGFEGYNFRVNLEFNYPIPQFMVAQEGANKSAVLLRENDRVHQIRIMNNDGPGFSSAEDAFNFYFGPQFCPTCVKSADSIPAGAVGATEAGTFTSADTEVIVFNFKKEFFVAAKLLKPAAEAENVLRTLKFNYARTTEQLPYQQP